MDDRIQTCMDLCVLLAWDLKSYFSSRSAEFLDENWTISLLELSLLSAVPLALMKGSRSANMAAGLQLFSRFSRFRKDSAQSTWFGESGHAAVEETSCSKFWLYRFFRFRDNDFTDNDCELCAVCGAPGTESTTYCPQTLRETEGRSWLQIECWLFLFFIICFAMIPQRADTAQRRSWQGATHPTQVVFYQRGWHD